MSRDPKLMQLQNYSFGLFNLKLFNQHAFNILEIYNIGVLMTLDFGNTGETMGVYG